MSKKIDHYLIVHEYTCPTCGGYGYTYHNHEWDGANKAWDEAKRAAIARGQSRDYAIGAAYEAFDRFWAKRGYQKPPLEDLPCGDCETRGLLRETVDLREALAAICTAGDDKMFGEE